MSSAKRFRRTRNMDSIADESSKKALSLVNLPLDTLIHIQNHIEAQDILALRRCCKVLLVASRERTVWINALRNACRQYSAYTPSFPVEEMSLIELEYTATAHYRFSSRLWSELSLTRSLTPIGIRVLKLHPQKREKGNMIGQGGFADLTLVPGGRFLFTRSTEEVIQLWDLGMTPDTLINNNPLVSFSKDGVDSDYELLTQPTADGSGILLLLVSIVTDKLHFDIYEVFPLSKRPKFTLVASFRHELIDIDAYTFTPDRLVFHGNECVVVWNFINNTWVKWSVERDIFDIILFENNAIFFEATEFSAYNIPPLEAYELNIGTETFAPPQSPVLRVVCPLDNAVFSSPSTWHTDHQHPFFDVIGNNEEENTVISRFTVLSVTGAGNANQVPKAIPVPIDTINGEVFESDTPRFKSVQLTATDRLLCWIDDGALKAILSTMPAGTQLKRGRSSEMTGVFWRWPKGLQGSDTPRVCSFCSMSGRLCVTSWEGEIRVLDYVQPPV